MLAALVKVEEVGHGWLEEKFGVESVVGEQILSRLQRDETLRAVEGSDLLMTNQEGMIVALKKFLGYRAAREVPAAVPVAVPVAAGDGGSRRESDEVELRDRKRVKVSQAVVNLAV